MLKSSDFKNATVRFSDQGEGKVIVLLHGFLESLEIWTEFTNQLSEKFRVIAIDLPGHGETASIGYVHSMELMAECVKAVTKHLGLRKYVVVGHSMGGYVALALTELYPDDVKGLCLFHSNALADSAEKKKERDRTIEAVKKNHKQFINELILNLFAPDNISSLQEEVKKLKSIASKTSKQGIIAGLEGMKGRKSREGILKAASFPILFIAGKQDALISINTILPQLTLAKNGTLLVLENAGHAGFYEAKEETLNTIEKFTKKCFRQ